MTTPEPAIPDRDARLGERLLALEESHMYLARSLEVLSGEIIQVGTELRDLVQRMDRMDERLGRFDAPPSPDAGPFDGLPFEGGPFGAGPFDDRP